MDPFGSSQLDLFDGPLRSAWSDQLGFVQTVDRLGQRVVIGAADRSDRGLEGPDWDFDTKTARWSIVCRWSAGWSNWRGIYGSKGDNS